MQKNNFDALSCTFLLHKSMKTNNYWLAKAAQELEEELQALFAADYKAAALYSKLTVEEQEEAWQE